MTRTIEDFLPEYLRGLPVYVPGRPIEEVERELKIHAIKLASNENPLGPSPKAMEAARCALPESHRYPEGGTLRLRERLAGLHNVQPGEIFIGLGSSEIIDVAARVMLRAGRIGLTSEGSYPPFSTGIRANGGQLALKPMKEFAFDLRAIAGAVTAETRIIYLANPNNPTGTAFSGAELNEFLSQVPEDVLVVLDEAYIHYANRATMPRSVDLFRRHKNLLILRTFSKIFGLAGLRIGYAIGLSALVEVMNKLRTPFNVSCVAQAAALAALDDDAHVRRSIETNAVERKRLEDRLAELGMKPVASQTNFVFVEVGAAAKEICDDLLHAGSIVRPMAWMGFPKALRVSVGTADENGKFLETVARVWPKYAGAVKSEMSVR